MNWREIKTDSDRSMWFWEREQEAVEMAQIARDIWKDKVKESAWWIEAERYRKLNWPKDRSYSPIYPN